MERWTEDDLDAVRKLKHRLETDPSFSAQDAEIIKEMVNVYIGIRAWGRFARIIVVSLAASAAAVTAWEVIWQKVRTWFGS